MKTIALRFSDNFAPKNGTIAAHQELILSKGFAWFGKLGSRVSISVINDLLQNDEPKNLLIHSGKAHRYWAFMQQASYETPPYYDIPEYYRDNADKFGTWFKLTKITEAPKDILSHCRVSSSNRPLTEVSKSSMSPYFIIEVETENGTAK